MSAGPGILDRLAALDTCAVSDALDTLGLGGATVGIQALWPSGRVVAGRAYTITAGPTVPGRASAHIAAAAIEDAGPDHVLVIDNGGRTDVSCFGGILTVAARRRGIRGVVIDGACRDIAESETEGFPVWGRSVVPVSARGRIVQLAGREPVTVAGATVRQDDLVIADRNGVVFVPSDRAEAVVDLAQRIVAREEGMAAAVRDGRSVAEVMHDSRFPTLDEE